MKGETAMSVDIFVRDIPAVAKGVDEIPEDFQPQPIGRREWVLAAIRALLVR